MSFLAPWFLLGALAVAGPVVFHLIRRSARERMPFSSLLFLRPTPPRATRRRKLEHIVLLVLRCLAVLLLAFGFARPFLRNSNASPSPARQGSQRFLLVDTSASMRREGLWPAARTIADRYLNKARLGDRLAVITFDRQPRTLVSLGDWSGWPAGQRAALAAQRLQTVSPGWNGTHLGLALTTAAELFTEESRRGAADGPREVVLITDLQEGSKLDGLQGHDWPKGVRVLVEKVEPKRRGNAGLQFLDPSAADTDDASGARLRVVNSRDSAREQLSLSWVAPNGAALGKPAEIYLPPGQSRIITGPPLPPGTADTVLRLSGDSEDFDNTAYYAPPEIQHPLVAYFGRDSAQDPQHMLYYLQRAFPATARRKVDVLPAISAGAISAETLSRAALAVIPGPLEPNQAEALRHWLAAGKTALLVLTNAQAGPSLSALAGITDGPLAEASGEYALLGDIDFTHPIFAAFAEPRFSDFSRIHFWKHRRWTIPPNTSVKVLAKFDDGAPALAQLTVGQGTLLVLAAGWHPADSQLALATKFLPLMQTILDWSGGAAPTRNQFEVGEPIPSPVSSGSPLAWKEPDGNVLSVAAGAPFTETDLPGIYTIAIASGTRRFAVNLPLDESRTAPLSVDDLARLGVPVGTATEVSLAESAKTQRRLRQEELENRQKLWRWGILALLGVSFAELGLAGWLGRRVKTLVVGA